MKYYTSCKDLSVKRNQICQESMLVGYMMILRNLTIDYETTKLFFMCKKSVTIHKKLFFNHTQNIIKISFSCPEEF